MSTRITRGPLGAANSTYAMCMIGDSMAPRVRAGEWLLVEPSQPAQPGDDVIVKTVAGQVMVKRLISQRDGEIVLDSVNETFKRITVADADTVFIHCVVGYRAPRTISQRVDEQVTHRQMAQLVAAMELEAVA